MLVTLFFVTWLWNEGALCYNYMRSYTRWYIDDDEISINVGWDFKSRCGGVGINFDVILALFYLLLLIRLDNHNLIFWLVNWPRLWVFDRHATFDFMPMCVFLTKFWRFFSGGLNEWKKFQCGDLFGVPNFQLFQLLTTFVLNKSLFPLLPL